MTITTFRLSALLRKIMMFTIRVYVFVAVDTTKNDKFSVPVPIISILVDIREIIYDSV